MDGELNSRRALWELEKKPILRPLTRGKGVRLFIRQLSSCAGVGAIRTTHDVLDGLPRLTGPHPMLTFLLLFQFPVDDTKSLPTPKPCIALMEGVSWFSCAWLIYLRTAANTLHLLGLGHHSIHTSHAGTGIIKIAMATSLSSPILSKSKELEFFWKRMNLIRQKCMHAAYAHLDRNTYHV